MDIPTALVLGNCGYPPSVGISWEAQCRRSARRRRSVHHQRPPSIERSTACGASVPAATNPILACMAVRGLRGDYAVDGGGPAHMSCRIHVKGLSAASSARPRRPLSISPPRGHREVASAEAPDLSPGGPPCALCHNWSRRQYALNKGACQAGHSPGPPIYRAPSPAEYRQNGPLMGLPARNGCFFTGTTASPLGGHGAEYRYGNTSGCLKPLCARLWALKSVNSQG